MALYRETATGFVQEWASNPGAGYTAITAQPTDTLANRVTWWRNVDKGAQTSSWHPSEYRTPQDPAEAVLSMAFSKDAAFFSADGAGTVTDNYLGGSCTVSVYRGGSDVTDSEGWTLTKVDEGCTSTLTKAGGVWTLTITSVPLLVTKSGYVRVTATRTGSTTQVRDWNWMKVQNGVDGTSAKVLTLSATGYLFRKAKSGVISPTQIDLTAQFGGALTGTATWETTPSVTLTGTGNARVLTSANFGANTSIKVRAYYVDGGVTYEDSVTIALAEEGADAITAVLANEAHTFPAGKDGTVSSYAGSGTEIRVYAGATLLDYDATGTANGTWKVTPATGTVGNGSNGASNITLGTYTASGTTPNRYLTVGAHAGVAAGVDLSSIDYTITGKSPNGTAFSLIKRQSFGKSKTGADGSNGTNGTDGTRGSRQILVTTADGVWADLTAWNGIVTQTGTTPVLSDLVTIAKTDGSVATSKFCTGNSASPGVWTMPNAYINGSLLVTGTVGANQIAAGSITTSKLAVGSGGNIVSNSGPVPGAETVDWAVGELYLPAGVTASLAAGAAGEYPIGGASIKATVAGTPTSTHYFGMKSADVISVVAGQKYEFSGYLTQTGCSTAVVYVEWLNNLGALISISWGPQTAAAPSNALANWPRSAAIATAPANAVSARLNVRGLANGTANPKVIATQLLFGKAGPNQTEFSDWSPAGVGTLIDGTGIKAGSITADRLVAGTITAASAVIANAAIETATIKDAAITTAKIGDLAVTAAKIADATITAAKIANATITDAKIANATITSAKIVSLSADKISAGTINAAVINVTNLRADEITVGTLVTEQIGSGAITAAGGVAGSGTTVAVNADYAFFTFSLPAVSYGRGNIAINWQILVSIDTATALKGEVRIYRAVGGGGYVVSRTYSIGYNYTNIGYDQKHLFTGVYFDSSKNSGALDYKIEVTNVSAASFSVVGRDAWYVEMKR